MMILKKILPLLCAVMLLAGCGKSGQGLKEASQLAKAGDWAAALPLAEARIKEVPTDMEAAVLAGLCIYNTGRGMPDSESRALNYLRQAAEAFPDRYDVQFAYGNVLYNMRQFSKAYAPLKNAYELHLKESKSIPQEVQGAIRYVYGMTCLRNKKYEEAAKYLEQASRSNPYASWPELRNDIAVARFNSGKYMDAMKSLSEAMNLDKANAALSEKKKKELAALMQKGSPSQIQRKQKELSGLVYKYPHVTALNMAIVCDYLSFSKYNQQNPEAFKASAKGWYDYSYSQYQKLRNSSRRPATQAAYAKTIGSIEKRRNALGR